MLFPKPVGNTAIESFLSNNTFCIIPFCSDLSCRWNCLSCRIRFISILRMQIIWHAALSSSHHAMRCCQHSISIARSRLQPTKKSNISGCWLISKRNTEEFPSKRLGRYLSSSIIRHKYFPSPLRHCYTLNSLPILSDINVSLHLYDTVIHLTPYLYCSTQMFPFTFTTLLYR